MPRNLAFFMRNIGNDHVRPAIAGSEHRRPADENDRQGVAICRAPIPPQDAEPAPRPADGHFHLRRRACFGVRDRRQHPRAIWCARYLLRSRRRLRHIRPSWAAARIDRSFAHDLPEWARDRMPYLFASGGPLHQLRRAWCGTRSKQIHSAKIDKDIAIRNFAYPYGDMSIRTKRNLEERFDSCRSCYAGINSSIADLGALKAWPLEDASLDRAGVVELITRTARSGGWLIFYSHDVAESPSRYGVSPDLLEAALKSARELACVIDTIAGCLRRAGSLTAREAGSLRKTPR